MKWVYAVLLLLGILLPFYHFIPWLLANGVNFSLAIEQISVSALSAGAWLDVVVSAFALAAFILWERGRIRVKGWWLALIMNFSLGVSAGLPCYLLLRHLSLGNTSVTKPLNS